MFRDYENFLSRTKLYEEEVWACKYSSKGGLTYMEAAGEEKKALAALEKVGCWALSVCCWGGGGIRAAGGWD